MIERRLCRGSNAVLLRCWCDEGRISAVRARFTHSPSTPPILTSEFFIADRRMLSRFDGNEPVCALWLFLWRLHRNEPGCVVGEHMHDFFWAVTWRCFAMTWLETVRFGEMDRSRANRTECEGSGAALNRFTRVGEVERGGTCEWGFLKKLDEGELNGAFDVEYEQKLLECEREEEEEEEERSTGPLDFVLEELAITKRKIEREREREREGKGKKDFLYSSSCCKVPFGELVRQT